jgi:hypothetical protein
MILLKVNKYPEYLSLIGRSYPSARFIYASSEQYRLKVILVPALIAYWMNLFLSLNPTLNELTLLI